MCYVISRNMKYSSHPKAAFTLVEIMVVVAIIALLASIAVPNFLRARKRSHATRIMEDLRMVDSAIDMYAIENNKSGGDTLLWKDIQPYLKKGGVLYNSAGSDMLGGFFVGFTVDQIPKLRASSFAKLSDVAPAEFWSPFYP